MSPPGFIYVEHATLHFTADFLNPGSRTVQQCSLWRHVWYGGKGQSQVQLFYLGHQVCCLCMLSLTFFLREEL